MRSLHAGNIDIEKTIISHPSIGGGSVFVEIGLRINRVTGSVFIYELKKNSSDSSKIRAGDYLYQICSTIAGHYFPHLTLSAIKWSYRSGFAYTGIRFRSFKPGLTFMRLSNILGIDHGGGLLEEYKRDYFQEADMVRLGDEVLLSPSCCKSFYVLSSPDKKHVVYMVGDNSGFDRNYKICVLESDQLVAMVRKHQPLLYQLTPDLMLQNSRTGNGLKLSRPVMASRVYCQLDANLMLDKLDIIETPEAFLGFIDRNFSLALVLARRGSQSDIINSLCGARVSPAGPEVLYSDGGEAVISDLATGKVYR